MIVGDRKPIGEIVEMIEGYKRVLVMGCGTCVAVCMAGGEKEVGILSSELRILSKKDGKGLEVSEVTPERQCEWEFLEEIKDKVEGADAVLSMACGAGVQALAERFGDKPVYPGLNTRFIGIPEEQGVWAERCASCGDCILDLTGGICPIARCSKSLLNGPCGGSKDGKCEIDPEVDCAWQLIYDRLKVLGELDKLEEIIPLKDWSVSRDGGPRKAIREDMRL